MTRPERTVAVVREELATVERYLADAPPHSGSGVREQLQGRAQDLRRELERLRGATARGPGQSSSDPSTDTNDSISPG